MAAPPPEQDQENDQEEQQHFEKLLASYLGLSFTFFLGFLPKNSVSLVSRLRTRDKDLCFKLMKAEEQLKQLHSRRKEDSKANARVVEIFASHRHAWQQEEKRLLQQIDESAEEIVHLRGKVEDLEKLESELRTNIEDLKREIAERDEMLNFMSLNRRPNEMENSYGGGVGDSDGGGGGEVAGAYSEMGLRYGKVGASEESMEEECFLGSGVHNMEDMASVYGQSNGFSTEYLNSASKFWAEKGSLWQVLS